MPSLVIQRRNRVVRSHAKTAKFHLVPLFHHGAVANGLHENTGYTVIIRKSYIAEKARIAHSGLKGLSISAQFAQRRVFREERAFKVVSVLWCSSCEG